MYMTEADLGQAMALKAYREGHAPKRNQGGHSTGTRVEIIQALSKPMTTKEVAAAIGRKPDTIRSVLVRLRDEGKITAIKKDGSYLWRIAGEARG